MRCKLHYCGLVPDRQRHPIQTNAARGTRLVISPKGQYRHGSAVRPRLSVPPASGAARNIGGVATIRAHARRTRPATMPKMTTKLARNAAMATSYALRELSGLAVGS